MRPLQGDLLRDLWPRNGWDLFAYCDATLAHWTNSNGLSTGVQSRLDPCPQRMKERDSTFNVATSLVIIIIIMLTLQRLSSSAADWAALMAPNALRMTVAVSSCPVVTVGTGHWRSVHASVPSVPPRLPMMRRGRRRQCNGHDTCTPVQRQRRTHTLLRYWY